MVSIWLLKDFLCCSAMAHLFSPYNNTFCPLILQGPISSDWTVNRIVHFCLKWIEWHVIWCILGDFCFVFCRSQSVAMRTAVCSVFVPLPKCRCQNKKKRALCWWLSIYPWDKSLKYHVKCFDYMELHHWVIFIC